MRASWTDPDDVRPDAKRAPRAIAGWRTYCPLRKMRGDYRSGIMAQHIMAADRLREQVDLAVLGYSAVRPLIYVTQMATPRWGMGPGDQARMRAVREVRRVIRAFSPPQLDMLQAIVLRNMTLTAWTKYREPPSSRGVEKQRLLVVLDKLVAHFETEVADDLARGRRLAP